MKLRVEKGERKELCNGEKEEGVELARKNSERESTGEEEKGEEVCDLVVGAGDLVGCKEEDGKLQKRERGEGCDHKKDSRKGNRSPKKENR